VQISLPGPGGGVWARRTVTEMAAGPLEATGQPLDVALDTGATADGFLCVRGPDGAQRWTRDGRLGLDPGGRLITQAAGLAVLGESGQAIRLDPQAGPVTIDRNGRIRQGNTEAASLRLATFGQPERLAKLGGGLFAAPADLAPTPFRGQVVQGHVEASAVEPTTMLARLIETQRAYEANANMIRFQDQTLNRAVNDIGRIG